jgi:hypothetical protein
MPAAYPQPVIFPIVKRVNESRRTTGNLNPCNRSWRPAGGRRRLAAGRVRA